MRVGHVAHLGGAVIGVLLVLLLSRLPDMDAKVTAAKQAKGASGAISKPTGER
jgi:membrane associated rhomboid family serine protease